jgi:fluoroacetyl-CoA thioesterase
MKGAIMRESLKPGIEHQFRFRVPASKTVPHLYPEAEELQQMPQVLATGFLVGLIEWTCIQAINPHLDWPEEQSVGIDINIDHTAATPPGFEVCVTVKLVEVDGRRLVFAVRADDGKDQITQGTHSRFVIDAAKFSQKIEAKVATSTSGS